MEAIEKYINAVQSLVFQIFAKRNFLLSYENFNIEFNKLPHERVQVYKVQLSDACEMTAEA